MTLPISNNGCADQARMCLEKKQPTQAIAWLNTAILRTAGRGKRGRYETWKANIAKLNRVPNHDEYAKDEDAYAWE